LAPPLPDVAPPFDGAPDDPPVPASAVNMPRLEPVSVAPPQAVARAMATALAKKEGARESM
jgi:hypothetical protein